MELFCLFGLVMVGFTCFAIVMAIRQAGRKQYYPLSTFGTAHFASSQEAADLLPSPDQLRTQSYLLLGTYGAQLAALSQKSQESHVLLVAPTGQGKTSGIMLPGILTESGHRSLFINDTKGELIGQCLGWLSKHHQCFVLSPTRPQSSHHYNPLAHVADMEDAEDVAAALVMNTGESQEPFWDNASRLLLTAAILHLKETTAQAPFSSLVQMLTGSTVADLQQLLLQSPSLLARAAASSFVQSLSLNERLAGSIMVELATRLYSMNNPALVAITSDDEIDFDQFLHTPTAIFLSIPASQAKRLKWFSALFMMQLMKHLTRRAEEAADKRLARPAALYLDEFGNQTIPHFPAYISLVRSAGIALLMAIQSHDQLLEAYGEAGKNTILANATTHIVFPGCGLPETTYYSERLGEMTVAVISKSYQDTPFSPTTTNYGQAQRRLMTSDEIRRLPTRHLLVITENMAPCIVRNFAYFEVPQIKQRAGLPYMLPSRMQTPLSQGTLSPGSQPASPGTPQPSRNPQQFFLP
ncbi:type IV secretory system conjugative DNA transfer family protein [Ktedonosporobacter rubrisoli]|nr:type IV secretory system conjugative DNA transfer family protein [Ktedonosporobacter rubrisoli]